MLSEALHLLRYRRACNLQRALDKRGYGAYGALAAALPRDGTGAARSRSLVSGWVDGSRPIPRELDWQIEQFLGMQRGGLSRALDQDMLDAAKQDEREGRDPSLMIAAAKLQRTVEEISAEHWKPPKRAR